MGSARLKPACPTREDLSRPLGFPAPASLHALVSAAFHSAAGSVDAFCGIFEAAMGVYVGGSWMSAVVDGPVPLDDLRYQQTPPELLPLWTTGVDGEHTGLLVHAPELGWDEHKVGTMCPMDSDGVGLEALRLSDAVACRLWAWNSPEQRGEASEPAPEVVAKARLLESALGVEVLGRKRPPWIEWKLPIMPAEWNYERTSDGVGVCAPPGAFAPGETALPTLNTPVRESAGRARAYLAAGYPASALLVLRESYWNEWCCDGAIAALTPPLVETYQRLGRPLLAAAAASRGEKFR